MMNSTISCAPPRRWRPRGAEAERADIAHEHHRRVGVEPEETEARADQRGAEHHHLAGAGDMRYAEIIGEFEMSGDVGEYAEAPATITVGMMARPSRPSSG